MQYFNSSTDTRSLSSLLMQRAAVNSPDAVRIAVSPVVVVSLSAPLKQRADVNSPDTVRVDSSSVVAVSLPALLFRCQLF